jgi:hypothetical protein
VTGAKPGNQLAVRHGAHAQIAAAELQPVCDELRAALPVAHQADRWVVAELADALLRLRRLRAYVDTYDPFKAYSKVRLTKMRSAMHWESRYADRVVRLLKELGMTPAARAKLGLDIARSVSLAEAMSEKDPAKRRRLLAEAGVDVDQQTEGSSDEQQST